MKPELRVGRLRVELDREAWKIVDLDGGAKVLLKLLAIERDPEFSIRGFLYVFGVSMTPMRFSWLGDDVGWEWTLDGDEWSPTNAQDAFTLEAELDRIRLQ